MVEISPFYSGKKYAMIIAGIDYYSLLLGDSEEHIEQQRRRHPNHSIIKDYCGLNERGKRAVRKMFLERVLNGDFSCIETVVASPPRRFLQGQSLKERDVLSINA